MANTPYHYASAERINYYLMLTSVLYDDDARAVGIVSEKTDVRIASFFIYVWSDQNLRRWLFASNVAATPISESNFLAMVGWMLSKGMFEDKVSKKQLAEYFADNMPLSGSPQLKTIRNRMSQKIGPYTRFRLQQCLDASQKMVTK